MTQAPSQRRVRWLARGLAMGAVFTSATSWAACTVSATGLPFGAYNPANASATDAVGTVTVSCTVLVALNMSWTVTMSKGASSTYSPRFLANGAAHLIYNIYTTNARTTVWGDGTGATDFIADSQFLVIGTTVSHYTMYGRIPALQDVNAGAYSDSIVVTVIY